MNKKVHLGFLAAVVIVAVGFMTAISVAGFKAEEEIARLPSSAAVVRAGSSGTVAGVAVEKATVTIDRGAGMTLSLGVSVADNATVLDALTEATGAYGLRVESKSYGSMGTLVNTIGDLTGGQDGKYWSYYVNGQAATVAVDQQLVKPGDRIEFRFEKSSF